MVLTLGIVAAYGRWGHLFRHPLEEDFGEFGVLVKFPVPVKTDPVRWQRPALPPDDQAES